MKFRNIANAFCVITAGRTNLILDPWFSPGIYDGSWAPYPPVPNGPEYLKNATHCFISHIDDDHWDPLGIHLLSPDAEIYIPRQFPNHVLERKLRQRGLRNIHSIELGIRVPIGDGIELEAVPPMNSSGLEYDQNKITDQGMSDLAVDAGVIVWYGRQKLVLLSDNTPYTPEHAGIVLEHMKNCDLLAFNYNGAASDFPICYDMPQSEKVRIRNLNEEKRERAISQFIELVSPKLLLPYSSEFVLMGSHARKFQEYHEQFLWTDRKKVSDRYQRLSSVPSVSFYENDSITFDGGSNFSIEANTTRLPELSEMANMYYTNEKPHLKVFERPPAPELRRKLEQAVHSFFAKIAEYDLRPNANLVIVVEDEPGESITIDFKKRDFTREILLAAPYVCCNITSNYLNAILDRRTNWNSAQLSHQLSWKREPHAFDSGLYRSLNFLVPPPEGAPGPGA